MENYGKFTREYGDMSIPPGTVTEKSSMGRYSPILLRSLGAVSVQYSQHLISTTCLLIVVSTTAKESETGVPVGMA